MRKSFNIFSCVFISLIISGCDDKPKDLSEIHHSITSVSYVNIPSGIEASIIINHAGGFDQSYWLPTAGSATELILRKTSQYWPSRFSEINILINAETIDRLGNKAWEPALSIRYNSDAMKANYKNLGAFGTFNNFAQPHGIRTIGIKTLAVGCNDRDSAQYFSDFCSRALEALRNNAQ